MLASEAALATLTVSRSVLEKDAVLGLVVALSSPLQLKVIVTQDATTSSSSSSSGGKGKKGGGTGTAEKKGKGGGKSKKDKPPAAATSTPPLQLQLFNTSKHPPMTQRNAILRCLSSFPFTLDRPPYHLMGGYTTQKAISIPSQAALAAMSSWMSYASTMNSSKQTDADVEVVATHLQHLHGYFGSSKRAFLVQTGSPSLADVDVAVTLLQMLQTQSNNKANVLLKEYTNVAQWLRTVHQGLQTFVRYATTPLCQGLPAHGFLTGYKDTLTKHLDFTTLLLEEEENNNKPSVIPPVFYYGGEEGMAMVAVAAPSHSSTTTTATAAAGGAKPAQKPKPTPNTPGGAGLSDEQKAAAAAKRAQKAADKAAKKAKNAAKNKPSNNTNTNNNTNNTTDELDITALEIRVGQIVKAWQHPTADKLWCETISFGKNNKNNQEEEEETREIASGLRHVYTLDQMQNQRVLVLCNLKARNLVGFASHGMVLCATVKQSNEDGNDAVEFVVPPESTPLGERVCFEGYDQTKEPEPENRVAKKKIFEKLAPELKTDEEGNVVWKGGKAVTSGGVCRAVNGLKHAQVS